ncbi:feline leukemia virus subgroup C receptor-related protein 2-like [Hydractinia symbiolongicarpus]|uniref:feline leukemia virus subgroup C receptor-related protein 2-like n=1 Tax=Hydractinia symbiolongicarpus TaxID=13093 RepID=UPI00254C1B9F|nr:feline leukemia virus subgroup C receptor-related protein 2-like [Hydractinia symbiolongicarpus]
MQTSTAYDDKRIYTDICPKKKITDVNPRENTPCTISSFRPQSHVEENAFHLSNRRWLILMAYCLLTLSAGSSWLCFPAVSNIMKVYYNIGILAVNMLSIIFGIAIVIFSLPFATFLGKFGLGATLKLAAFANVAGASVKYFSTNSDYGYWFLLIGNALVAISVAGFLFLPGQIVSTWFSEKEIGKTTSVCIAFDALGPGLGFLHATYMIRNSNNTNVIGSSIQSFLLSQLVPAVFVFGFVLVTVKSKPKHPPNLSAKIFKNEHNKIQDNNIYRYHHSLKSAIFMLLKNVDFHFVIHLQGITASIEGIFEILLNEMLIELYPGQEQGIGMIGFLAVIFGFSSNILVGSIIDKTGSYRKVTFGVFFLTTFFCIVWSVLLKYVLDIIFTGLIYCLLMATSTSYYTIAFVHGLHVAEPISPSVTGIVLVLTSQIYDTVASFIATQILAEIGVNGVNGTAIVVCVFAIILSLFLKSDLRKPDPQQV